MTVLRLLPGNVVSLDAYRQARQELAATAVLYPAVNRWMNQAPTPEPPKAAA
jgi:hypothetical protein